VFSVSIVIFLLGVKVSSQEVIIFCLRVKVSSQEVIIFCLRVIVSSQEVIIFCLRVIVCPQEVIIFCLRVIVCPQEAIVFYLGVIVCFNIKPIKKPCKIALARLFFYLLFVTATYYAVGRLPAVPILVPPPKLRPPDPILSINQGLQL
jgi:hypothetical protein